MPLIQQARNRNPRATERLFSRRDKPRGTERVKDVWILVSFLELGLRAFKENKQKENCPNQRSAPHHLRRNSSFTENENKWIYLLMQNRDKAVDSVKYKIWHIVSSLSVETSSGFSCVKGALYWWTTHQFWESEEVDLVIQSAPQPDHLQNQSVKRWGLAVGTFVKHSLIHFSSLHFYASFSFHLFFFCCFIKS